jgi:hypothetical protein
MNPYGGINSPCSERADHLSCTIVTNNLSRLPCESKIAIFESLPNPIFPKVLAQDRPEYFLTCCCVLMLSL